MKRSHRTTTLHRMLAGLVVVASLVGTWSAVAAAHVSIEPATAQRGSFATFAFRVPNEKADSATTRLRVQLPPDHPMASVQVRPVPGWTVQLEKSTPPAGTEGNQNEVVSVITWDGGRIEPGEYQAFEITVGPLPATGDVLYFPAIQTYEDGSEATWIERPSADGTEAAEPAPSLDLVSDATAGSRDAHGDVVTTSGETQSAAAAAPTVEKSNNATTIASLSLGVAVVSLVTAAIAVFLLFRRSRGAPR